MKHRRLSVAMPAYNASLYIRQAIESVLSQQAVELDIFVVDDASTDDTAEIVRSLKDPRCRLLQNTTRRGIGYCHNLIVRESNAPVIAHVDADDMIMPGALAKMFDAATGDPRVAMAHCYFFDIDRAGRVTRRAFRSRWESFHQMRPVGLDYRRAMRSASSVANALRTYRRSALLDVGDFSEVYPFGIDYEMALRLLEKYEIRLVPEFLYARRIHGANTTESLRWKRTRLWLGKYRIRRALFRSGKILYWPDANFDLMAFVAELWAIRKHRFLQALRSRGRGAICFVRYRLRVSLLSRLRSSRGQGGS